MSLPELAVVVRSLLFALLETFNAIISLGSNRFAFASATTRGDYLAVDMESGVSTEKATISTALSSSLTSLLQGRLRDPRFSSNIKSTPHQPFLKIVSTPNSDCLSDQFESFVDLSALKSHYRLKLAARGQRYASRPSDAIKAKRHMTGTQLSGIRYPPEARGDDFRKWLLVTGMLRGFSSPRRPMFTIPSSQTDPVFQDMPTGISPPRARYLSASATSTLPRPLLMASSNATRHLSSSRVLNKPHLTPASRPRTHFQAHASYLPRRKATINILRK